VAKFWGKLEPYARVTSDSFGSANTIEMNQEPTTSAENCHWDESGNEPFVFLARNSLSSHVRQNDNRK
jgi:hypothetical protein